MPPQISLKWFLLRTLAACLMLSARPAPADALDPISRALVPSPAPPDGASGPPALSADGRYLAFRSDAANLVEGDTNGVADIFVRDVTTGQIERIHLGLASGVVVPGSSVGDPRISGDGRYVAFQAQAYHGKAPANTNYLSAAYLFDRETRSLTRVSEPGLISDVAISRDGAFIAYSFQASQKPSVRKFTILERGSGTTETLPIDLPGFSSKATRIALSDDGRRLAITSDYAKWVSNDTNAALDVFVFDRKARRLTRESLEDDSTQLPGDSDYPTFIRGGRAIAFSTAPTNAFGSAARNRLLIRDLETQSTESVPVGLGAFGLLPNQSTSPFAISDDANRVVIATQRADWVADDRNQAGDVFLLDRSSGAVRRVSVSSTGQEADATSDAPAISADGRRVAFFSLASNLPGRAAATVCAASGYFRMKGANVYLHDPASGSTVQASLDSGAKPDLQVDDAADQPSISADGRWVAFESRASNLVAGSGDKEPGLFLHDRVTGTTRRLPITGYQPSLSGDGQFLAFHGTAGVVLFDIAHWTPAAWIPGRFPALSHDGRYMAFVLNGIQLYDSVDGSVQTLFAGSDDDVMGFERGSPAISSDGRFVAFPFTRSQRGKSGLVLRTRRILLHDRQTGTTRTVSPGRGNTRAQYSLNEPTISPNGRFVVYTGYGPDPSRKSKRQSQRLFVYDRARRRVATEELKLPATQPVFPQGPVAVSEDGRYLAVGAYIGSNFLSRASVGQVLILDRQTGVTEIASRNPDGAGGNRASSFPALSASGRSVAFVSCASDLTSPGGSGHLPKVFAGDRNVPDQLPPGDLVILSARSRIYQASKAVIARQLRIVVKNNGTAAVQNVRVVVENALNNEPLSPAIYELGTLVAGETKVVEPIFVGDNPGGLIGTLARVSGAINDIKLWNNRRAIRNAEDQDANPD